MSKPNAIVITGVEFYEVPPGEPVYYHEAELACSAGHISEDAVIRSEAIKRESVPPFYVKRMPLPDRMKPRHPGDIPEVPDEYYIYAFPDVQDRLGLVYDAWNDMAVRINQDYETIRCQKVEIDDMYDRLQAALKWKEYYQTGNIFTRILKVIMK